VAPLSIALGVGLEVTQVTNVALLVGRGTVCLVVRVDCHRLSMYIASGTQGLTVRTGGCAAVGVVAKGVNVHTTLSIGVVASDVPCDGGV